MVQLALVPSFRWRLRAEAPAERDRLCRELELHPITAQSLVNRGFVDSAAVRELFRPSLRTLPDPETLPEFEAAAAAFERAFAAGRPILIHGDYDVDGMSGTALLARLLRLLGHPVEVFLPDRVRDGYSFSERSLDRIRETGAGLVVAVDNGTTAVEFIGRIRALGAEVVVVDHHPPGPERPPATALVNPWLAGGEESFFPHFCGTAVAYLFAWGLLRRLAGDSLPPEHRRFLVDALGLVAVATIADVMPLRGPNRALVTEGLRTLGNRGFPGLHELLRVSGVRGEPTAQDIGFRVAPRLNAAGRMGRTELALELLSTSSARRAEELAAELDTLNLARRELEQSEMRSLEASVEAQRQRGDRVIFTGRSDAAFGVLGIVANRFLDATGLPSLIWAECVPGLARGSARAPEGHDLVRLLDGAAKHLGGYGGHARAAGFHFDPADVEEVAEALRQTAASLPEPEPPTLEIDMEVGPADLSPTVIDQLDRLAPFGEQNPQPVFLASGLTVASARTIGDGSHLELRLERNGTLARALGWRQAERWAAVAPGDRVDAVFHAGINAFRGRRSVEWTLRDLRTSS